MMTMTGVRTRILIAVWTQGILTLTLGVAAILMAAKQMQAVWWYAPKLRSWHNCRLEGFDDVVGVTIYTQQTRDTPRYTYTYISLLLHTHVHVISDIIAAMTVTGFIFSFVPAAC